MSKQPVAPGLATLALLLSGSALAQASTVASAVPSLDSGLLHMFFALAGVLAILFFSLWLLKKLTTQRGPSAGLLHVVAAAAVGTRERVVIVEVGSTWLVLGVAPGQVSALAEIPRQPMPEQSAMSMAEAIPPWLQKLLQRK